MLAIIVLAALGWTGWWFFIATAKEAALTAWLDARRAAGWVAEAEAIDVTGFPYRVDTTVRGLDLANPEGGWAWSAPTFQFLTLAYEPNHLIAIWPPEQRFATPLGATEIRSETMRGSVIVEPNLALALERTTIDLAGVDLIGEGWEIAIDKAILATRQAEGADAPPFAHDIAFTAEGLALPEAWTRFDRANVLAPVIETVSFDALAAFDRPWDRPAIEGDQPALEALEIRDMSFAWGDFDLRGQGSLRADARGFAEGRIKLRARNWKEMLKVAEDAGALAPGVASALRGGLGLLARLGGDRSTLDVPLEFSDGVIRLGPVPLGPAPRMIRR
ncbi:MAG: DUF2125 domain-containing protein [Rhodobacteraceae bacterium]|nr:DUF2125 domain-containing protein [Paracoccaceae bacterium]